MLIRLVKQFFVYLMLLFFVTAVWADNLSIKDFVRIRASLDCKPVVFYWKGNVYSRIAGQKDKLLFQFEGYNIARAVPVKQNNTTVGYRLLTREFAFYENPKTGAILTSWVNPFTKRQLNQVIHVWNDPVNQVFMAKHFSFPKVLLDSCNAVISFEVPLFYPSPLTPKQYPHSAQSDMYQGMEAFQFFYNPNALKTSCPSIAAHLSWTRTSQWLPWMKMAQRPGLLVFHCYGYKLAGGWDALPTKVKQGLANYQNYLRTHGYPTVPNVYKSPPSTYTTPNETSWTFYKKLYPR